MKKTKPIFYYQPCSPPQISSHCSCYSRPPLPTSNPSYSTSHNPYLKTFVVRYVVAKQNGIGTIVVSADDGSKCLLASVREDVPAVSHICNLISSLPILTLLNLKSTPMVDNKCSSYLPSTNWLSSEDFPESFEMYPPPNHPPALACTPQRLDLSFAIINYRIIMFLEFQKKSKPFFNGVGRISSVLFIIGCKIIIIHYHYL